MKHIRSLGRKRKARTNKRRMMRGGDDDDDDTKRIMDLLQETGQSTMYDSEAWDNAKRSALRQNIRNLNRNGSTTTKGGFLINIVSNKLQVQDVTILRTCNISYINSRLDRLGIQEIYNYKKPAVQSVAATTKKESLDIPLLKKKRLTLGKVVRDPLSLIRSKFGDARIWLRDVYLKDIVPKLGYKATIKMGDEPKQSTTLYTPVDRLINEYNYARSWHEYAGDFKRSFLKTFDRYNAVSEFEKNKDIYTELLMNDKENTELLQQYNQLNIVESIEQKHKLVRKIMEAVAKYSKDKLADARRVVATKQQLDTTTPGKIIEEAPSAGAPSAVPLSAGAPSADALLTEAPSADPQSADPQSAVPLSAEAQSAEAPSAEAPSADAQPAEAPSADALLDEAPSADPQSADPLSAEPPPTKYNIGGTKKSRRRKFMKRRKSMKRR